jgi:hypothetical protein
VDGHQLVVGLVVELDLVGDVHADGVTTDSFARINLPDNELVVILSTERCQVLLIRGEGKTLNENLVESKVMDWLEFIEVPDDDLGLESHMSLLTTGNVFSTL